MKNLTNQKGVTLTKPRFITDKLYDNIVIDPPWPIFWQNNRYTGGFLPYKTMSLQQINELPITQLLKPDAYVFLWSTCNMLEAAYATARSWDITVRQVITWVKGYGMGRPPFTATEHCLMCSYGYPKRPLASGSQLLNHFSTGNKKLKHSQKPDKFFDHIRMFTDGKDNLEMFARSGRPGWDSWGEDMKYFPDSNSLGD